MPKRIGPRRPRKIYLQEWRDHVGLTQEQAGHRVGVSSMTISRWERAAITNNHTRKPHIDVIAALAEAYGIEPEDFYHDPARPSPNALLRDQPPEVIEQAINIIRAIRKAG